ncbi:MAG: iron ABC transporter permease [bacterium]
MSAPPVRRARPPAGGGAILVGLFVAAAVLVALACGPGGPAWRLPGSVAALRVLRVALGILAGGTLALTGAAVQGLLRNPLADPFTLGVSSGAAFGTTLAAFLGLASSVVSPLFGIAGAAGTAFLVYGLARVRGRVGVTALVLAGVITSFLMSSAVMLLVLLGRRTLGEAVYVLMGHLGFTFTTGSLGVFLPGAVLVLAGCAVLFVLGRDLDIISTGDEPAASLGVAVGRTTGFVFGVTALAVGIVVAFTGAISFVGLVVPHVARFLVGPRHRRVMPVAFGLGAATLLLADVVARSIVPGGLPLSVVTAFIGVPFFIYLLRTRL